MEEEQPQSLNRIVHVDCNACGSEMTYDPAKGMLVCAHCGNTQPMVAAADQVLERSFHDAIHLEDQPMGLGVPAKIFNCKSCGASTAVEVSQTRFMCPFCASENVNPEAHEAKVIRPTGLVAFKIAKQQAMEKFKQWIRKGFFAPSNLKRLARLEGIRSVYLPFWTYDADTQSNWNAEAGYYYYETEHYQERDGTMKERRIRKTRWMPVSGYYSHHFDDVLVLGSHGLTQNFAERIYPFDLKDLVNYDPRFLLGHDSEVYQKDVREGFNVADSIMDVAIRSAVVRQIPGDTYQNLRIHTHKGNISFKHILLPIWIAAYRYNGKLYRFLVNGQTGKISGKKPVSFWKVAALVLFIIGVGVGLFFLLR